MVIEDAASEPIIKEQIEHVSFLDTLAGELAETVNVNSVFGTAVERDGVTVIPVARARWGMGGGLGPRATREGERGAERGVGGGGGAVLKPIGFIELTHGKAKFRSIREPFLAAPIALATGCLALLGAAASMREPTMRRRFRMRRRARILSRLFR